MLWMAVTSDNYITIFIFDLDPESKAIQLDAIQLTL